MMGRIILEGINLILEEIMDLTDIIWFFFFKVSFPEA